MGKWMILDASLGDFGYPLTWYLSQRESAPKGIFFKHIQMRESKIEVGLTGFHYISKDNFKIGHSHNRIQI